MRTGLSHREALALAVAGVRELAAEAVPLASALGRVLAADFAAPFDLPGFANAAMDGFAVRAEDLAVANDLPVVATVLAGDTTPRRLQPGTAMAIMTGALMPEGADTVVIRENAHTDGGRVRFAGEIRPDSNVRPADDDCSAGRLVLAKGDRLAPFQLGVLASFGLSEVPVIRRPRVSILTTGDELLPPGEVLKPGQRHDSNGPMLAAAAAALGAEVAGREHCADDAGALASSVRRLCRVSDVLLTTGGVSAGQADLIPEIMAQVGEVLFWKVRMKPGMPVLHARVGDCRVFALPGNAVSAGVVFHTLVRPVLEALMGCRVRLATVRARMGQAWHKAHSRLEFLRVVMHEETDGSRVVVPLSHQGSGALSVLAQANALAVLVEGERRYAQGDWVEVIRL